MSSRKMIVVDLDGTLLNINQGCSKKTIKYLSKLKKMGYIIVIATGRMLRDAVSVTEGAKFANYIIASAGAIIYDMDKSKIISDKKIDKDEVRRICSYYNDEVEFISICDLYYYNSFTFEDKMDLWVDKKINDIDKFIIKSDGIYHMTFYVCDNSLIDKYYKMIDSDKLSILIMQNSFSDKKCIEIFSKGVSKYNAIKTVIDIEGICNDDVIAFGDGLNDVDMIRLSGIGVAMGNALDEVKEVSDYVTISHNNDGVIYFLKGYLNKNNLGI